MQVFFFYLRIFYCTIEKLHCRKFKLHNINLRQCIYSTENNINIMFVVPISNFLIYNSWQIFLFPNLPFPKDVLDSTNFFKSLFLSSKLNSLSNRFFNSFPVSWNGHRVSSCRTKSKFWITAGDIPRILEIYSLALSEFKSEVSPLHRMAQLDCLWLFFPLM